jgi:hypothetical protein
MNILEKFIDIFKQCIIILSGFEKLHLSEYATNLAKDFNFELIEFKYPDFESLNKAIKNSKLKNIIIYGLTFPTDKLEFKANYHLSLSGNKTLIDDESQFNLYNQYVKENFINKFKNIKAAEFNDEISDDIFNTCIQFIMKKVYGDDYEKAQERYIEDTASESVPETVSESELESDSEENKVFENENTEESSVLSREKNKKVIKGTRKILKRAIVEKKKVSRKTTKKTTKKGGSKKNQKPKKINKIVGTRLVKSVIKK